MSGPRLPVSGEQLGALFSAIHDRAPGSVPGPRNVAPLNVLVLYASQSMFTGTVADHLNSFRRFSRHNFYYADSVNGAPCNIDLDLFDAVVLHYGCGLYHPQYFSTQFAAALKCYSGLKIAFVQDEYDWTERIRARIEEFGIKVFFTCVPEGEIAKVYPPARFPLVQFISNLTGYVPASFETMDNPTPLSQRRLLIGYRGRPLHFKYGDLGQEKINIGKRMRQICEQRGLPVDIDWTEESRIYWDSWYRFLSNCRATLGTESGSNVFDFDGSIRIAIDQELAKDPDASYEEIRTKYLAEHEGRGAIMNQISPKIFEAIALRTALVLFEGGYSGVLQPDIHYIPLKKDFSNVDDVLKMLQDDEYLTALTARAFDDVIRTGNYSYRKFISNFDDVLERHVRVGRQVTIISSIVAAQTEQMRWSVNPGGPPSWQEQIKDYVANKLRVYPPNGSLTGTATSIPIFSAEQHAVQAKAARARVASSSPSLAALIADEPDTTVPVKSWVYSQFRLGSRAQWIVETVAPVWVRLPRPLRSVAREIARWALRRLSR